MALPVGFCGSLQWIGWLSLLDEVALNHWNTQIGSLELMRQLKMKKSTYFKYVDEYKQNLISSKNE